MPPLQPKKDPSMKMTKEAADDFIKWVKRSAQEGKKCPPRVEGRDLIILAMGPSRGQCPFDAETWGLNTTYVMTEEFEEDMTKLFIVHKQVYALKSGNPYFNWEHIEEKGYELITTHRMKGVKSKLFPMKRISERFPIGFFSDTITYMIAYALYKSTKEVDGKVVYTGPYNNLRLYGVDMQEGEEYEYEKGGIEYWLGIAQGLGIGWSVGYGSTLFDTYGGVPYGQTFNKGRLDPKGLLRRTRPPTQEEIDGEHREVKHNAPWKIIRQ